MKSWQKPTPEIISHAVASTLDAEQRRYFFNNLQNPFWARPLWEKGFFRNPPEPVPTGDGGVQIPLWPESQYLARVARDVPADVVEIVLNISTSNLRVLEDIVDMALTIDLPDLTKQLVNHADNFADNPFARWHYQKLGKLILHWGRVGLTGEALRLTERVISFRPDPLWKEKETARKNNPDDFSILSDTRLEPELRCDQYVYQKILDEDIPQLAELLPWETARVLADALANALTWSFVESGEPPFFDGSDFWCRDLKIPRANGDDPKSCLGRALTRASETVLLREPARFSQLDELFRSRKWYFFSRLRWHLYARFPEYSALQIRRDVTTFPGYEDGEYGYEFASMIMEASKRNLLEDQELSQIFEQIERGPDIEGFKRWVGSTVTDEQIEGRRGFFFSKQMYPFSPILSRFPDHWGKYQRLIKKHGERKLTEYYKAGEAVAYPVHDKSPITADDLLRKSDEQLLIFLRDWKSQGRAYDFDSPSVAGLSTVFTEAIKRTPERFLNMSNRLKLPPIYVRDFLYVISEMVRQKQPIPWLQIVELSEWIIAQPTSERKKDDPESGELPYEDFTECRHVLGGLYKHGSYDYPHSVPSELRTRVFQILQHLCTGADPRLDDGKAFGNDWLTQAINSVRTEAIHALVDHAFWIKRHLKLASDAILSMPEVAKVLEDRLDPSREQSLAAFGLFGFLTPSLYHLDSKWCESVRRRIYPSDSESISRWMAAWTTYISWNHANPSVFTFLNDEYHRAVEMMDSIRKKESSENRPIEALGEHLIILFGLGLIPLADTDSVLRRYLEKATPAERAHIMSYAGRALRNTQIVPEEIKSRLMAYWEFRLRISEQDAKPEESSSELSDFVWWFRSGKFNVHWVLVQLEHMLNFVSKVPESMFLVEGLAEIASEYPKEAAKCLKLVVSKTSSDRYVYLDEEKVKQVLRGAASSQISEAVTLAQTVQDELLRLGRFEYSDLAEKV